MTRSKTGRKIWLGIKKKHVDNWEPTHDDIDWLVNTVRTMEVGGKWVLQFAGVTFEKVGSNHLRVDSIVTDNPLGALVAIEKTRKVGERAAIEVDVEKAAEYATIDLKFKRAHNHKKCENQIPAKKRLQEDNKK